MLLKTITLPNGKQFQCEVVHSREDIQRGLMFRRELPPNRGMLFVHPDAGRHFFWMKNTLVPLDIVWLGSTGRIVELASPAPGSVKPVGGNAASRYTLELPSGGANGLSIGETVAL